MNLIRFTNLCPSDRKYSSIRNFSVLIEQFWNEYIERNFVHHQNLEIDGAAELVMLTEAMYKNHSFTIELGSNLEFIVNNLGYNISGLNKEALAELARMIFNAALSIENDGIHSMDNIHKALINVVKVFTSYNIQFVSKTSSKPASDVGVQVFRLTHISTDFSSDDDVHIANYPF